MDDRRLEGFIGRLAHGLEPYRRHAHRASWWITACLALLALVPALRAHAAPRTREIRANGKWKTFDIKAPEEVHPFLFEVTAGCRYRLTVQCRTLRRVLVEFGPGDAALYSADSAPPPKRPGVPTPPQPKKPTALVVWDAENDGVYEARVRGFSALTGRGRLKLETLGPDDEPVKAHRRMLAPGGTLARVGALWVGEPNRWELVVKPGWTYEVRSRPGTAGRIALAVIGPDEFVFASAGPDERRPYPTIRFVAPKAAEDEEEPPPLVLVVTSVDGGGGTYGVRLIENPPRTRSTEGTVAGTEEAPTPPTGLVDGLPLAFHAHPGDLAVLYLPRSHVYNGHPLQRLGADGRWRTVSFQTGAVAGSRAPAVTTPSGPSTAPDGQRPRAPLRTGLESSPVGERASMRTPEQQALVWFRAFRSGTYRFIERRPHAASLTVYPSSEVPPAPALVGTGLDPRVSAHGGMKWRAIGLGVCIPGMDYLFVAVGRRKAAVGMRVVEVGDQKALRRKQGVAPTRAPGLGPTYRFRVTAPTLVRLEVKGRSWIGYAMMGRAAQ